MIKIDRTRIAPPPELIEAAGDEAVRAKEFYTDPNNIRYGKSFQFKAYHSGGVRESLLELFHDKCAFCESKLGVSSQLDIDQFRPKAMAVNHDGSIDKPGYWWLAWEWSNLYPACPLCNRTKANRFPVVDRRAEQVEAGSNRNTINPADNPLQAVAIYSEGKLAITVSEDGAIDYCDLETAKISLSIKSEISDPSFVAATPDGKRVVFASQDGQWVIWDSNRITPETDWEVFSTDDRLRGIAISPDGRRVILAAGESLQVWDDKVREMVQRLEGHSDWVNALAISPDGRMVISAAEDTTLGVWDLESGEELRTLRGHERPVYGVCITADGKRVISLSVFGTLRVWDLESGEQLFEIEGDGYGYKSLAISADGRFAVCRQQRNLRVMDLHTRQERVRISHHGAQINDATVTPDGRYVLTAGSDGALEIWNLHSIGAEKALILDPCQDDPENYLVFREDGLVASVPPDSESLSAQDGKHYKGLDRGQITIDTFGLNRAELVEERRLAAKQLRQQVQDALGGGDPDDPIIGEIIQTKVNDLLSPHHAYAAIRRQLLPRFIDEIREEMQIEERLETEKGLEMTDSVDQEIDQYAVKDEVYDEAFRKFETRTSQREAMTPDEVEDRDVFIRSAMVSRVEIKNFQCLDTLSFDFSGGSENRMSWKVLLGENGVGKSSVLEAVALALMGKKYFDSIEDIEPDTLLKRGTKGGYIKVHFSTDINPIEVEITTDGLVYPSSETGLRTYLSGFGSARWLPRKGSMEYERDPNVRVRNLFNPFVPLTDAINILISMKEKQWYKNSGISREL